ncbi:MAG: diadenylate cyclase CdaA [Lachnospirales bacterium]
MNLLNEIFKDLQLTYVEVPRIGLSTILDILLVTFIIYKLLIWIKETRAWALLKGLTFILFISFMAYLLNLYTVTWIISNTFNVGLIAIIVIFTPEIRKALEELGTRNMSFMFMQEIENKQVSAESLDNILRAAHKMADEKTGAIVVIENSVALKDIADTGIQINAVITTQLLVNIFEDKTPLHDGAVVIRDNKIVAASCILPLTKKEIGKELGTRHRASVGISENSDAYVIVVSEETGKISLATNGNLHKDISDDEIKKIIRFKDSGESKRESKRNKRKKIFKGRERNE